VVYDEVDRKKKKRREEGEGARVDKKVSSESCIITRSFLYASRDVESRGEVKREGEILGEKGEIKQLERYRQLYLFLARPLRGVGERKKGGGGRWRAGAALRSSISLAIHRHLLAAAGKEKKKKRERLAAETGSIKRSNMRRGPVNPS